MPVPLRELTVRGDSTGPPESCGDEFPLCEVVGVSVLSLYWKDLLTSLWSGERRFEISVRLTRYRELTVVSRRVNGLETGEQEEILTTRNLSAAYRAYATLATSFGKRRAVPAFDEFVAATEEAIQVLDRLERVQAVLEAASEQQSEPRREIRPTTTNSEGTGPKREGTVS